MANDKWWIAYNGEKKTATFDLLLKGLQAGKISPDTLVWKPGMPEWLRIRNCEAFAETLLNIPPPLPKEAAPPVSLAKEEVATPLNNIGNPKLTTTRDVSFNPLTACCSDSRHSRQATHLQEQEDGRAFQVRQR